MARRHRLAIVAVIAMLWPLRAHARSVAATSEALQHPAEHAVDGDRATQWCPKGRHGSLTITLAKRSAVEFVTIDLGAEALPVVELDGQRDDDAVVGFDGRRTWVMPLRVIQTITITPPAGECVAEVVIETTRRPFPKEASKPRMRQQFARHLAHDVEKHRAALQPIDPIVERPVTERHVARAVAPTIVTNETLDSAIEQLRALRTAIEDGDADSLSFWVGFPIVVDGRRYGSAKELAGACRNGDVRAPLAKAIEDAFAHATVDGDRLDVTVDGRTWRLRWMEKQWWLVSIE